MRGLARGAFDVLPAPQSVTADSHTIAVPLWVARGGGPIGPANEAHDVGVWRDEQGQADRIKIRVKAAMGTQAKDEGRFLGGRPPHGYLIADSGPHPNPARWKHWPGSRDGPDEARRHSHAFHLMPPLSPAPLVTC